MQIVSTNANFLKTLEKYNNSVRKVFLTYGLFLVFVSQTTIASNDYLNNLNSRTDTSTILDQLNKEINADPTNAIVYYNRGIYFFRQQKYEDALADFEKAIKLKNDFAEAYNERANTKFDGNIFNGEKSWAWDDYEKAIGLNPNLAKAYFDRGTRLEAMQGIKLNWGCTDICKAYELGYIDQKEYYYDKCDCKK
jgi:tetratricopeptide (TPR) repeat protein